MSTTGVLASAFPAGHSGTTYDPAEMLRQANTAQPATKQWDQTRIQDAILEARAQGFSDADVARGLGRYGVSFDQAASAFSAIDPKYSAYNASDTTGNYVQNATNLANISQGYVDMGWTPPSSKPGAPAPRPASGPAALPPPNTSYTPVGWTPASWNVTPEQTVENRVKNLIDTNSPLMQQAHFRGLEQANARGLLNSSMAAGAAQSAVMDRALEIARPDAATFADSARFNAASTNAARSDFANASNRASEFSISQAVDAWKTQYNASVQQAMQAADIRSRESLARLDGQIRENLTKIEAGYKNQLQTSQSAATLYADAIRSVTAVLTDPKMNAKAKQNAINQLMGSVTNGLQLLGQVSNIQGLDELLSKVRESFANANAVDQNTGTT